MSPVSTSSIQRRRNLALFLGSFCLCGAIQVGCDSPKPKEVSAESSGYRPTDAPKQASGKEVPKEKESSVASSDTPSTPVTPSASTPSPSPEAATPPLPTAPSLPEFDGGKVDAQLVNREFMKLALPKELTDPKSILAYIVKNTQATRELLTETGRQAINREVALHRALELGRDKIKASEALMKVAEDNDQKSIGAISKLEALAQMANVGDVISADDLYDFATEQSSTDLPEVAEQATAILIAMALEKYEKDAVPSSVISELVEKALRLKQAGSAVLQSTAAAISHLQRKEEKLQTELAKKLEEKFRSNEDINLEVLSWNVLATQTPSWIELQKSLDPRSAGPKTYEETKAKVEKVLEDLPQAWTPAFLVDATTNVEYSGYIDAARAIIEGAEGTLDRITHEEIKPKVASSIENFWKRTKVLGSSIDFSGLAEMNGDPFSFEQYKGKIVVVDFWATWCGPCIQEIPNLKEIYEKKQSEGVEILGINIDDDRTRLEAFLNSEKLPWKTVVSASAELKGFETEAVTRLGIQAIPFIAVIGRDGNVVAIHTRGRALDQKIEELLKAK